MMHPGKFTVCGILLFVGLCFTAIASGRNLSYRNPADTVEKHIKGSLVSNYKKYPQEKVFVHTNQPVYCNGETIWYKVYTMAYGKPSGLSKIIYVQLSDTAGNIITQNKLPLIDGKAHGNIDISQKIKSGWYKLSAFTSWMMNFGREGYYNQRIYIRNLDESVKIVENTAIVEKKYHIDFYPEGGDVIGSSLSKIAFKAYSDDGMAARVTGIVKENLKKSVAELTTVHDGMGFFTMEGKADSNYTASVQFPDGSRQEIPMPKVKETGISLQASQNDNTVDVKLAYMSQKQEEATNCVLAVSQNSGLVATYPLRLGRGINTFKINKKVLSTGILRVTIFDHNGIPQSERIVFVNKHDIKTPLLKADTLFIAAKANNGFSVQLKDNSGLPVKGNFSLAVTDGDAFEENTSGQNIFSALLLSPELKGEIHDPGYYFKNQNDSLAEQLDLVMLTNGWRHFVAKDNILSHPVEQSQYIAGTVIGFKNQNALKIKMLIMSPDSTRFLGYVTPDKSGRFIFNDFNKTGLSDMYLETADRKSHIKKMHVKLFTTLDDSLKKANSETFKENATPDFTAYYLSAAQNEYKARLRFNGILLKEVNIRGIKVTPMDEVIKAHVTPKYETGRMFTLDLVNNPTINMPFDDYIKGRFPGLQVFDGGHFVYRGSRGLLTGNKEDESAPYFYVNEAPVTMDIIDQIPLSDMAIIRFIPPPVYFAPFNGGFVGAIMVYTKNHTDDIKKTNGLEGFDHFTINGYSIAREFFVPDYKRLGPDATDNRTTLYWNNDINTDKNGVLHFRFNNSDKAKKFRIILQGMDNDGKLVYLEKTVQ